MAEMPDVVTGEIIDADLWGNPIRDRTVQRYADETDRDAKNPTPATGDLAALENASPTRSRFQIYWAGKWQVVAITTDNQFLYDLGTSALPTYSFGSSPSLGMYAESTAILGFTGSTTSGVMEVSDDWLRIRGSNGAYMPTDPVSNTPGQPTYAFRGDTDTGMYHLASDIIGLTAGGQEVMRASTTQVRLPKVYTNTTTGTPNIIVDSAGTLQRDSSSLVYKDNLVGLTDALDTVKALRPISYTSKLLDDARRFVGFGAEDVAEVIPEAAADEYYDVRSIVAYLTAAVQELAARLEDR